MVEVQNSFVVVAVGAAAAVAVAGTVVVPIFKTKMLQLQKKIQI